MKIEFIYSETISVFGLQIDITRQKNTPNGEWYGINIVSDNQSMADNDEWIINVLYPMLKSDKKNALKELNVEYSKETAKALRKLIKEALKLGWFHALK